MKGRERGMQMEKITKQKLCWQCREWLIDRFGTYYCIAPLNHCHHDEPEEKPEVKCWCDEPDSRKAFMGAGGQPKEIQFCPVCGKSKKDWEKR
jgi:hypothetical protein